MTFRNRYVIAAANGISQLTIPVVGGREQKTLMRDVLIDHSSNWQKKHWRSLTSAYSKAPYFPFYSSPIRSLLFSGEKSLFAFNINILSWIFKALNINVVIEFTTAFEKETAQDADFRNLLLPKNFQADRDGWLPVYPQVFEDRLGFQRNLSIIDLLFCEGPNSIHLLNQVVK